MVVIGAAGAASLMLSAETLKAAGTSGSIFVYVGSYTKDPPGGGSNNPIGLSVFKFDPTTGALTPVQQVKSANPSFVALDPTRRFLYVINEIDDYEGQKLGSAEAYAIDPASGMVTLLNRQPVGGPIPAHLAVDPSGRHLVVGNYTGGNFVVLPIEADGRLGPVSGEIKDSGAGPNKQRQEAPHPHAVVFDPAGRYIAAADLGIDKVLTFRLNDGGLVRVGEAPAAPGAGPRHLAFDTNGRVLYVVNELNATVSAYAYDPATGQIGKEMQTISTEPAGYAGPHSTAEIVDASLRQVPVRLQPRLQQHHRLSHRPWDRITFGDRSRDARRQLPAQLCDRSKRPVALCRQPKGRYRRPVRDQSGDGRTEADRTGDTLDHAGGDGIPPAG